MPISGSIPTVTTRPRADIAQALRAAVRIVDPLLALDRIQSVEMFLSTRSRRRHSGRL